MSPAAGHGAHWLEQGVYEERLTELGFRLVEEGRESCCLQLPEGMCQENGARSSSKVQHKKFIRNIYKLECGKLQVNVRREKMLLRDLRYWRGFPNWLRTLILWQHVKLDWMRLHAQRYNQTNFEQG